MQRRSVTRNSCARRIGLLGFLVIIFLTSFTGGLSAAETSDSPEELTDSLIRVHAQHHRAPAAQKPAILSRLQKIAAARNDALAAILEHDPEVVLKLALPPDIWRGLPVSLRNHVEEAVELDGNFEILQEDRVKGSRLRYKLKSYGREYALHFKKDPPNHLRTGTRVRVRGIRVKTALALESGSTHVEPLVTVAPNTFGNQSTLVILVNFRNNTARPYTADYANNLIFTTTSNFFLENSYQQTFLSGIVKGWYTIDMDSPRTTCDYNQIASKAEAAAQAAGVVLSHYRRRIYAFPDVSGCGWWGLGTVGGNPSRAWINGSLQLRVVAHELGHNFGLWHSHSLDCGAQVVGGYCMVGEYGDTMDVMGSSAYHFNAFQKERLGWLDHGTSPPITTAESSSSYSISPYETLDAGPKALKILKSTNAFTGKSTYYYAECRRPIGFDANLAGNANAINGFVIHTGNEATGDSSYLLDMTPDTASWNDPALVPGFSYNDRTAGVRITPEFSCGDALDGSVAVNFAPPGCDRDNPDITLSPNTNQWMMPGGSVSYSLRVRNKDGAGCGPAVFDLSAAVPDDWSFSIADPSLTISPGETGTTALSLTAPEAAEDGYKSFSATASLRADDFYTDAAAGGVAVISSLEVNVWTTKPAYRRLQLVTIKTTVTALDAGVPGVPVNLTLTKPTGAITHKVVKTNTRGVALYEFQLGKSAPTGVWQVDVSASASSVGGSASNTFTVSNAQAPRP